MKASELIANLADMIVANGDHEVAPLLLNSVGDEYDMSIDAVTYNRMYNQIEISHRPEDPFIQFAE